MACRHAGVLFSWWLIWGHPQVHSIRQEGRVVRERKKHIPWGAQWLQSVILFLGKTHEEFQQKEVAPSPPSQILYIWAFSCIAKGKAAPNIKNWTGSGSLGGVGGFWRNSLRLCLFWGLTLVAAIRMNGVNAPSSSKWLHATIFVFGINFLKITITISFFNP